MGNFDALKEWELVIPEIHQKYKCGENSDAFEDIKGLKPVFAFDYICLDKTEFSFCGNLLGANDYRRIIKALKQISAYTYEEINKDYRFHFHEIKWEEVTITEADFNRCVYGDRNSEGDITPYQIKFYNESRAIGFIYKGVFYLVMFDRGHKAYPRRDRGKRKK